MLDALFNDDSPLSDRRTHAQQMRNVDAADAQILRTSLAPVEHRDVLRPEQPDVRRLPAELWRKLSDGMEQRYVAVEAFLADLLTRAQVPAFLTRHSIAAAACASAARVLRGINPDHVTWSQLLSADVYVGADESLLLLDENYSCPIGLERLAQLEGAATGDMLTETWLKQIFSPADTNGQPQRSVMMDSGSFNTAFRENSFLARTMDVSLVSNRDLRVTAEGLFTDHGGGSRRISCLFRRVDDDLLDPNCFRPDSLVGVPGVVRACRQGQVRMVNMPGTGLFRNRSVSAMIPDLIRHYLHESPLLPSVRTLLCGEPDNRDLVLGDLNRYSVRTIDVTHPARPFFGNAASAIQKAEMAARLLREPAQFVARPILEDHLIHPSAGAQHAGFNLRIYGGGSKALTLLAHGIGRQHQPDGGATIAIISDPTAFFVGQSQFPRQQTDQ